VSVPVGLAVAQDRDVVRFRQIHRGCGQRINLIKTCPEHGALTADDVVKGYEYGDGRFLEVTEGELDAARPDGDKTILIRCFTRDGIDPRVLDRTYFLVPSREERQREGYALLAAAMEETGASAIAEFVLWGRENLCAVRAQEGRLMLDLLYRPEDLRDSGVVDGMVDGVAVSDDAVALAVSIVEGQIADFDHSVYASDYNDLLRTSLDARAQGKAPKRKLAAPKPKRDEDLVAALRATLAAAEKPKRVTRKRKAVVR
jgi:DNA end-binding protein Ku